MLSLPRPECSWDSYSTKFGLGTQTPQKACLIFLLLHAERICHQGAISTTHRNICVRPIVIAAQVSLEDIPHITDNAQVGRIILT